MSTSIEKTRIQKRIEDLIAERDDFVEKANREIVAFNARIDELRLLIVPEPPTPLPERVNSTDEGSTP